MYLQYVCIFINIIFIINFSFSFFFNISKFIFVQQGGGGVVFITNKDVIFYKALHIKKTLQNLFVFQVLKMFVESCINKRTQSRATCSGSSQAHSGLLYTQANLLHKLGLKDVIPCRTVLTLLLNPVIEFQLNKIKFRSERT